MRHLGSIVPYWTDWAVSAAANWMPRKATLRRAAPTCQLWRLLQARRCMWITQRVLTASRTTGMSRYRILRSLLIRPKLRDSILIIVSKPRLACPWATESDKMAPINKRSRPSLEHTTRRSGRAKQVCRTRWPSRPARTRTRRRSTSRGGRPVWCTTARPGRPWCRASTRRTTCRKYRRIWTRRWRLSSSARPTWAGTCSRRTPLSTTKTSPKFHSTRRRSQTRPKPVQVKSIANWKNYRKRRQVNLTTSVGRRLDRPKTRRKASSIYAHRIGLIRAAWCKAPKRMRWECDLSLRGSNQSRVLLVANSRRIIQVRVKCWWRRSWKSANSQTTPPRRPLPTQSNPLNKPKSATTSDPS